MHATPQQESESYVDGKSFLMPHAHLTSSSSSSTTTEDDHGSEVTSLAPGTGPDDFSFTVGYDSFSARSLLSLGSVDVAAGDGQGAATAAATGKSKGNRSSAQRNSTSSTSVKTAALLTPTFPAPSDSGRRRERGAEAEVQRRTGDRGGGSVEGCGGVVTRYSRCGVNDRGGAEGIVAADGRELEIDRGVLVRGGGRTGQTEDFGGFVGVESGGEAAVGGYSQGGTVKRLVSLECEDGGSRHGVGEFIKNTGLC